MKKKAIISVGAGNVASHLIPFFHKKMGYEISQVYSRKLRNARKLAKKVSAQATSDFSALDATGKIAIICLPDDIIPSLNINSDRNTVLLHTSGSTSSEVLSKIGSNYGALYPLQTFQKGKKLDLKKIPVFTTGNNTVTKLILQSLANGISDNVVSISDEERSHLHLAAVMSNNFIHHLAALSEKYLIDNGLHLDYLLPILKETFTKISQGDLIDTQTGPARRNDKATLGRHKKLLRKNKEMQDIYKTLTKSIKKQYL